MVTDGGRSDKAASRDPAMFGQLDYGRRHAEAYFTEPWITKELCKHVDLRGPIWEPACGRGDMTKELCAQGYYVFASDLYDHGFVDDTYQIDFLDQRRVHFSCQSIVTNPPFLNGMAERFVRHALGLMNHPQGMVCMLLRHEFDCAAGRVDLFTEWPFRIKLVLTRRPRWDWWEREKPQASPRHNFAWFIWDFEHKGPPELRYQQA